LLTWGELQSKLEMVEAENSALMRAAANTNQLLKSKLQQSEKRERILREDIRSIEMSTLRNQHAALRTSQYQCGSPGILTPTSWQCGV